MKQVLGVLLGCLIGAAIVFGIGYHAPTVNTPVAQVVKAPEVWNRVNVPDFTLATAKSMGDGGHMNLVLKGIHAKEGVDDVQVYISMEVPDPDHPDQPYGAVHNCGQVTLESKGADNTNESLDVSEAMQTLVRDNPAYTHNVEVFFVVTPKNHGVQLTEDSFLVDDVYFEVFDKDGKPVAQPKTAGATGEAQAGKLQ